MRTRQTVDLESGRRQKSVVTTVLVPKRLEISQLLPFVENLRRVQNEPEVRLDFAQLQYARPTGSLVFGGDIRRFVSIRQDKGYKTFVCNQEGKNDARSYLSHIGFFDFI